MGTAHIYIKRLEGIRHNTLRSIAEAKEIPGNTQNEDEIIKRIKKPLGRIKQHRNLIIKETISYHEHVEYIVRRRRNALLYDEEHIWTTEEEYFRE